VRAVQRASAAHNTPRPLPVTIHGPVPVTVHGKVPITTSTAVPVDVVHIHQDFFGLGTFIAALVAAVAAIAALMQLARRSKLTFAFEEDSGSKYGVDAHSSAHRPNDGWFDLEFRSHNVGSKTSRDYYVTVLLPNSWEEGDLGADEQRATLPYQGTKKVDYREYKVYQVLVRKPLYPGRWGKFARRRFWAPYGEHLCLWHVVDEDGAYPKLDGYGRITVVVSRPPSTAASPGVASPPPAT